MDTQISSLNLTAVTNRVKLVTLTPRECWQTISNEQIDPKSFTINVIAPLIVIGIICSTIGLVVFGVTIPVLGTWRPPFLSCFIGEIAQGAMSIAVLFLAALIVQKLTSFFQGSATYERSFSLVAHAALPGLAARVLMIYPTLSALSVVFGIVGLYALYQGSSVMTTVQERHRLGFIASFIVAMIIASAILFGALSFTGIVPQVGIGQ